MKDYQLTAAGLLGSMAEVPDPDHATASTQDLATDEACHGTMAQASLANYGCNKGWTYTESTPHLKCSGFAVSR